MMSDVPSVSTIQRTNLYLLGVLCVALLFWSVRAAMACLVGGLLMALNVVVLTWFTQLIFRAAARGGKASPWLVFAPLKLLVLVLVAYLVVWRLRLDARGFALGISTPFFATLVEAARAAVRRSPLVAGYRV